MSLQQGRVCQQARKTPAARLALAAAGTAALLCLSRADLKAVHAAAGPSSTQAKAAVPDLTKIEPRAWVVDAANNEIKAIHHENSYLRYLVDSTDQRGHRLRDTIESKDGTVARLIRKDGRSLTPDEETAERDRLQALSASPSAFARHQKDDMEGKKLAVDLIRLLPDAMQFSYVPGQPQISEVKDPQIVIDYTPKPNWNPPTTISAGLKGLRGRAWIDARSRYVVRMEGEIFQGVNFGWGMLAHIYPGGRLYMEQRCVHPEQDPARERWIVTRFRDDLKVRAVMVKTITVQTDITFSQFQVLPGPSTYQLAIQVLLSTSLPN